VKPLREAIILAGGQGTRLRSVVSDVPKPMAPVAGRPFLAWILDYVKSQGVERVILATGHLHFVIDEFFGNRWNGIGIHYSLEEQPLGTGGAMRQALSLVEHRQAVALNGDTCFLTSFAELLAVHDRERCPLTMALKPLSDFDRYGSVIVERNRIAEFRAKGPCERGLINAGTYILERDLFSQIPDLPSKFSFETDVLEARIATVPIAAAVQDAFFIDIGIPEDYRAAQTLIPAHIRAGQTECAA